MTGWKFDPPMTRARPTPSPPRGLGQRTVLIVALLAFVLQNFALQTHVHHAAPAYSHAVHVDGTPAPLPFNSDGSGDDPVAGCARSLPIPARP